VLCWVRLFKLPDNTVHSVQSLSDISHKLCSKGLGLELYEALVCATTDFRSAGCQQDSLRVVSILQVKYSTTWASVGIGSDGSSRRVKS